MPEFTADYALHLLELAQNALEKALNQYTFELYDEDRDGRRKLLTVFNFACKPEDVECSYPSKSSILQTLEPSGGGYGYIEDFGLGPPRIILSGTTGRKPRVVWMGESTKVMTGLEQALFLKKDIFDASHDVSQAENGITRVTVFHDWKFDAAWEVNLDSFSLRRSTSRNLLYMYRMEMTAVRPYTDPAAFTDPVLALVRGYQGLPMKQLRAQAAAAMNAVVLAAEVAETLDFAGGLL